MALTDAEILVLQNEINTDPESLGYAGLKDEPTAELLNEPGASGETVPNTSVPVEEVMDAVVSNELGNVPINEFNFFLMRIQKAESINISAGSPFLIQISQTFSQQDAPDTRAALTLLKERPASRAEILFSEGVTVSYMDVGTARLVI